jgi:protein ImuB
MSRMIAVWCPDWPVTSIRVSEGLPESAPIAVLSANRVVSCSYPARVAGVQRGLLRREAQARCPELIVAARNVAAEARLFEPIVVALESIAPGVEITRPGLAAIGAQGPTRYFGGEPGVLAELSRAVAREAAGVEIDLSIGVADGAFAAEQAARRALIVAPGGSPDFLAPLPIGTLDPSNDRDLSALVDLLTRLGLITLGQFAALAPRDVLARFGPAGVWAHRQAGGRDDRPVAARRPAVEFGAELEFEPALDQVDSIAFSARELTERFIGALAAHGLACTCLELQASTENGEETVRRWRHAGVLQPGDVLDRIRWQLSGWRPTRGVTRLRLIPIETVPTGAHQRALWGGSGDNDERAQRALARVQTLLGHGSVLTAVLDGGRDPIQRTTLVAWGDEPVPMHSPQQPWPGRLPPPTPSVLVDPPLPIQVLDDAGQPVLVTERGAVPAPPARLVLPADGPTSPASPAGPAAPVRITSWAGPWPVDERWWAGAPPGAAVSAVSTARARFQLVDVRGQAYLVACAMAAGQPSRWTLEARYD